MSGSISVLASFLALFYDASHARVAFGALAGLCALMATYRVWAKEREKRIAVEAYLVGPDFSIELGRCYRWTGDGGPFVLLETTFTNRSVGTATVMHWSLTLILNDQCSVTDSGWTAMDPYNQIIVNDANRGGMNVVSMQTDDLATYLAETMLPRGQHCRGFLEFYIRTALPLENAKIEAELTVTDSLECVHKSGKQTIQYVGERWVGGNASHAYRMSDVLD
jgi:hypothetical protein